MMKLYIKEDMEQGQKILKLVNALIDMYMKEDYDFCVRDVVRTRKFPELYVNTIDDEVKFIQDNQDYLLSNYNINVNDYDLTSLEEVADTVLKQIHIINDDIWNEYGPKYIQ